MTLQQQIGAAVREARLARGWTQQELARRAGVSARQLRYVEAGTSVGRRSVERMQEALGVELTVGWRPVKLEEGGNAAAVVV